MPTELVVDWQKFRHILDAYSKTLVFTGEELAGNLRYEAPVDTGRLAGSFAMAQVDRFNVQVGTNVVYSIPVMGKTVRNPGSSARPPIGTMGNDYADRAIETTKGKIKDIIHNALRGGQIN